MRQYLPCHHQSKATPSLQKSGKERNRDPKQGYERENNDNGFSGLHSEHSHKEVNLENREQVDLSLSQVLGARIFSA